MSITISNCNHISKSPLNNSTAKMLYSFSKEPRFVKRKQILQIFNNLRCDKFYTAKSNSHLRATSFGFGDKYDFTRDASCSPPPNTYNLQDSFIKNSKKGFGFGKGRQQMEVTGPFVASKKNKNSGPDSYALPSMLQKTTFSFRPKLNTFDPSNKAVPGPGAYPVTFDINQKGNYFLAKYKTVMARDFGKYAGRCHTSQQRYPGPGSYTVQGIDLSPKGKYVSSKLHNCLTSTFHGFDKKFLGDKTNTPGPGNYRLPSDFGYYESVKNLGYSMRVFKKSNIKSDGQATQNSFAAKESSNRNEEQKLNDKKLQIQKGQKSNKNQNEESLQ